MKFEDLRVGQRLDAAAYPGESWEVCEIRHVASIATLRCVASGKGVAVGDKVTASPLEWDGYVSAWGLRLAAPVRVTLPNGASGLPCDGPLCAGQIHTHVEANRPDGSYRCPSCR